MKFKKCKVVQLHDNLDSFQCSYCAHLTSWDGVYETVLVSEEEVSCLNCVSNWEEQQAKKKRTIHAEHLQPNIVLFDNINDPLSDTKASIIDNDANLRPDILLIIETSLTVNGSMYKLKNKLILAIHHNNEKVIYVNNSPFQKPFCKPLIDHIFEMNCNIWVWKLATHKSFL